MARSHIRGHDIEYNGEEWVYSDTKEPTVNNERDCGHCGLSNTMEGHDGCLGTLKGVMNACCGHGDLKETYIQFENGKIMRGLPAETVQKTLIEHRELKGNE